MDATPTMVTPSAQQETFSKAATRTIVLAGNPNCGKTTLFNALTGARQHVGNWPGVTVERKAGDFRFHGVHFELVDLPGTYSLDVTDESLSLDEQIARDYVANREADLIVNIVDAANSERNLYLTAQLIEMRVPVVVALNMMDVAEERGIRIDIETLSEKLGCPVVPIVATKLAEVRPPVFVGSSPARQFYVVNLQGLPSDDDGAEKSV